LEQDKINILDEKIENLIKMYQNLKAENESLRNQLIASQSQNESLNNKARQLEDQHLDKSQEIDSILEKINNITN
jgi:FtsZ-binding cell division protein ZapB